VSAAARIALVALPLLSGCAWSLVQDGRLREEPFAEIVTRTAAARGDPRPAHVDARVVQPGEVPELMRASILSEWSPEEIARYQERLVAIGLWPPQRDLVEETVSVAKEEVAGFYLSETRVLYVVEGLDAPFSLRVASALLRRDFVREVVLTHEIVHLLQHLEAPLLFEVGAWTEQDDAAEAVQAAIEGDATHYGMLALLAGDEGALPDPGDMQAGMEAAAREESALAKSPALVRLTLAFPYASGYPLSREEGTALLHDPPASTEQVIHADRRRAEFQVADLAGLEAELPAGCESLGQNTVGELLIWVLLTDFGALPAEDASDGWDGDRYLAARCGERRAFFWWTAWDSEEDAAEFAAAYADLADHVAARAGLTARPEIRLDGAEVILYSEPLGALLPRLGREARRARITTLDELRAHFGLAEPRVAP
jgi:hypothetical protein